MKRFTIQTAVLVILVMGLTGCNWKHGGNNSTAVDTEDTEDTTIPPVTENENNNGNDTTEDFPEEALAVRPEPAEERRSEGSDNKNRTHYLSIFANELLGCMKRRVEINGIFNNVTLEYWSPTQVGEWVSKNAQITVTITEDSSECGGYFMVSKNTVFGTSVEFPFSLSGQSVNFYAEIPVYNAYTGETSDVTVVIEGSEAAQGKWAGGYRNSTERAEWGHEYDSSSTSVREGVDIVLHGGGVYINQQPVEGIEGDSLKKENGIRVSRDISNYKINGVKGEDPFNPCCASSPPTVLNSKG